MVTRSYDNDYRCIACSSKHSMFVSETINVIVRDEAMPDESCACAIRYSGMTMEVFNFYILSPLSTQGKT